jgi:hypothetical protein
MNVQRIITGLIMILKMLLRRRIVLILIAVVPAIFLFVVEITTPERIIPFRLASMQEEIFINISQKGTSIVFLAVACAGFLVSFLALNLIQKSNDVNHRLIICGYHPLELLVSHLLSLMFVILIIAVYVGILTTAFYPIKHLLVYIIGIILIGLVYGCYGLFVGSLIKGELEGILLVVLLANIDAGWLQNPIFFAGATNKLIIKFLPAYFPSQTAITGAFTDYSALAPTLYSLAYGTGLMFLTMLLFFLSMKIKKP